MPPADQPARSQGSDDSLLGDFDLATRTLLGQSSLMFRRASFNSEDELPPELRKAVVKSRSAAP